MKLTVGPLSTTELGAVLSRRLDRQLPRPRLEELRHASAGNPMFALELARFVKHARHCGVRPMLDDLCAIPARGVHFGLRCILGHDDDAFCADAARGKRAALCGVSRRDSDNAALFFGVT